MLYSPIQVGGQDATLNDQPSLRRNLRIRQRCRAGNLLGIQPFMTAADYASEDTLYARLAGYLEAARQRGWLGERTIVVWPEYIGTWLAVAGERPGVYRSARIAPAMRALALGHPLAFARSAWLSRENDRLAAGLFRMKAAAMARTYQAVFSRLARRHAVTVVAGSILLPSSRVEDGAVVAGGGPLHNVCAVYRPDGRAHAALARKACPISAELPFVTPASVGDWPAFDTPAGKLGVLVCADSWYPAPYDCLRTQGIELIAVPSFIPKPEAWDKPWEGYSGAPAPDDVDPRDVGALTEGQAWRKYALAGRIARSGARHGINVFLFGALWDLGSDSGVGTMVSEGMVLEARGGGPAILNLWL